MVSDIPAGDGKTANLFLRCNYHTVNMAAPKLMKLTDFAVAKILKLADFFFVARLTICIASLSCATSLPLLGSTVLGPNS